MVNSRDYSNGKIYCIRNSEDDEFYIGSTTQPLSKRFQSHKTSLKGYKKDRKLYSKMNVLDTDKFYIELIEEYPCDNIEQLNRREGEIIRQMKPTLNKQVAGRTINEWREDHKEDIRDDKRQYHLENQEKFNEKSRQWHHNNRERAKTYKATVVNCNVCGVDYTLSHRARHLKTKRHQNYLNYNIDNV